MGRRTGHIIGPRPAKDPMKELMEDNLTIKSDTEVRWIDRSIHVSWTTGVFFAMLVIISITYLPYYTLIFSGAAMGGFILIVLKHRFLEQDPKDGWETVPEPDMVCIPSRRLPTNPLVYRGVGGQRYISALSTDSVGTKLYGNLGHLIRSISTIEGFHLSVQMWHDKERSIVKQGCISKGIYTFLDGLHPSELEDYIQSRGGLWRVRVTIIGHSSDRIRLKRMQSAIKSILSIRTGFVSGGLRKVYSHELATRIRTLSMSFMPSFYALGNELSEWLVQHHDELAGELKVPTAVPGQFITPIRQCHATYIIGRTFTPETGEIGPQMGFTHSDLEHGLLVCGEGDRRGIITLLISQLLEQGKHVLMVTRNQSVLDLCGLSNDSLGFVLGKTFVMNPVDPEGIERNTFVSRLVKALEVLPNQGMTAAPELDKAIGKVAAIGHSTIADIMVEHDEDASGIISRSSQSGLDAIEVLRAGSGAPSFYGNQTAKMSVLDKYPLSVIVIPPTNENLERFAWDLLCIKLTSLAKDPDRVIILESPQNFKTSSNAYKRRSSWESSVAKFVKALGPLIISTTKPSSIGDITQLTESCISTRLRDDKEVAVGTSLLRLHTYERMHSKVRQGHRATAILSTLKEHEAILMPYDGITAIPVQLNHVPSVLPVHEDDMRQRIERVSEHIVVRSSEKRTLIDMVSGGDHELVMAVLKMIEQYEPVSRESIDRFLKARSMVSEDTEGIITRLEQASIILRGHEKHGSTTYQNWRLTLKGKMAIKQAEGAMA